MRGLYGTPETLLVIQAPTWMGVLLVIVGIIAVAAVFVRRIPRPYRLGACLASIIALYTGWYMLNTSATFETRGFIVEGMLGEEERHGWTQVSGVDTGNPVGSKSAEPVHLVIQLRNSSEVAIDVSGLSADEKSRLVSFIRTRINR